MMSWWKKFLEGLALVVLGLLLLIVLASCLTLCTAEGRPHLYGVKGETFRCMASRLDPCGLHLEGCEDKVQRWCLHDVEERP